MMKRKLGRSLIDVSPIGLGCYAIGGTFWVESGQPWGWDGVDDKESIRAIRAALDMGVNFLDTANAYGCGHSERIIGRAVKGRRDQVVIATKFGKLIDEEKKQVLGSSIAPNDIRQACEDSLHRLDTDYIDLFQWHESQGAPEDVPGVLETLDRLVASGKIRYIGWSTDDPERARLFAERPYCVAVQHRLHVLENPERVERMLAVCEMYDLASINRSPLLMGILTGKFDEYSTFSEKDVRHSLGFNFRNGRVAEMAQQVADLRDVLTSDDRTPAQGALAWIWARSPRTIPIPGFKTVAQVQENAGAMQFGPLNPDQMHQIDVILNRKSMAVA